MSESQNPADRDRPLPEVPPSEQGGEPQRRSDGETAVWTIVGIVVLIAIAAGAIAGFLGGRIFEYTRTSDDEVIRLLGALPEDSENGVILTQMQPNGPANSVGLLEGAELIRLDGEQITSADQAKRIIASHQLGYGVLVTYSQNFTPDQKTVILGIPATVVVPTPDLVTGSPPTALPPSTQQGSSPNWFAAPALGVNYRMGPIEESRVGEGAFINSLVAGGPAYNAGIKVSDTIIAIDGYPVNTENPLEVVIRRFAPREQVVVTIIRHGEELDINVVLAP